MTRQPALEPTTTASDSRPPCRPRSRQVAQAALLASALALVSGESVATAQTVMVRNAPPGSTVELVINTSPVGSATVGNGGDATISGSQSPVARAQMDANVFVDVCPDHRRVVIVARGADSAALESGCTREDMGGVFFVQKISTLVIDAGKPIPSLLLRQGPFNPNAPVHEWGAAPTGLILAGGGAYTFTSDGGTTACGNVTACNTDGSGFGYAGAIWYWFLPFLAAEATYVKPGDLKASGTGTGYKFDTFQDVALVTLGAKAGVPVGALRIYGKGGMNYHRATFSTTETIDDKTITVDGVSETIPGGTQTLAYRTAGWGWQFGGGVEAWFSPHFGVFGEFGMAWLRGSDRDLGEAKMDDRVTTILFGGTLHIGKWR